VHPCGSDGDPYDGVDDVKRTSCEQMLQCKGIAWMRPEARVIMIDDYDHSGAEGDADGANARSVLYYTTVQRRGTAGLVMEEG
jgi:hypothetical protein